MYKSDSGAETWAGLLLTLALCGGPAVGSAQESPSPPSKAEVAAESEAPTIALDQLLKLPGSYSEGMPTATEAEIAGATAPEWRVRFGEADEEISAARGELAEAQQTLESSASGSSQWNLTAPGVQAQPSKDSSAGLPHRQRIQRLRERLDEAERAKRSLEVEADLAGVPPEWRK